MNNYIFVNYVETYKFKGIDSEVNAVPLCLVNVSKDFPIVNIKRTELCRYVYDFSVDYDSIGVANILDIHNY